MSASRILWAKSRPSSHGPIAVVKAPRDSLLTGNQRISIAGPADQTPARHLRIVREGQGSRILTLKQKLKMLKTLRRVRNLHT